MCVSQCVYAKIIFLVGQAHKGQMEKRLLKVTCTQNHNEGESLGNKRQPPQHKKRKRLCVNPTVDLVRDINCQSSEKKGRKDNNNSKLRNEQ